MSRQEKKNKAYQAFSYLKLASCTPFASTQLIKSILKKCWIVCALSIILLALCFSFFRALTPWAKQYKTQIESQLSAVVGQPVRINSMETSWYWFNPVLKLDQISVTEAHKQVLKLDKLLVGINLFSSLWHWQVQPGVLYIDDLQVTLHQTGDTWKIEGLGLSNQPLSQESFYHLLNWVLAQDKIKISNASAMIRLENGSLLPVEQFNLTILNKGGRYHLKGSAHLKQTTSTQFSLIGDFNIDHEDWRRSKGELYLELENFLPAQWQGFALNSPLHIHGGEGDAQLWLNFQQGRLVRAQSKLSLNHLSWSVNNSQQIDIIQDFQANLAWKSDSDGWQLTGDGIKLKTFGVEWPENKLRVNHNASENAYRMYVKSLLIDPIVKLSTPWHEDIAFIHDFKPKGVLHDVQIGLQHKKPFFLLTRFSELSWNSHEDHPGVKGLAGVLNWQQNEGHLELDSQNAAFILKDKLPIYFADVNGVVDWKALSNGTRVSLDRLVLTRPDLILSANGVVDRAFTEPYLQIQAQYALENAEQWLPYLPSESLKPKLDEWLKNDVKHIKKGSGKVDIMGKWRDFPFDKEEGTFYLSSYLKGVDLYFNNQWPITKNIDAYLTFDKRKLDAEIFHAEFPIEHISNSPVPVRGTSVLSVNDFNLNIQDIGYDKETLLIHGRAKLLSEHVLSYILATPLKKRLSKLKQLDLKGPIDLNLNLEVPLYHQKNSNVQALGEVAFENNNVIFHHSVSDLELESLSGSLEFDEHGVIDSSLNGKMLGDPIQMRIQSIREEAPYTEVTIQGNTSIDLLKKKFDLPILSFLDGHFDVKSRLIITDDPNDLDQFTLDTSLDGVAIDLPAPLGKSSSERTPLNIKVNFNPDKGLRLLFNYNNRLSSNLWFAPREKKLAINHGEIRLGSGTAVNSQKKGIQLVGTLETFNADEWLGAYKKLPQAHQSSGLANYIDFIDLEFETVQFLHKNYKNLLFKGNKTNFTDWSLQIKHDYLSASLLYQKTANTLSGHCDFFHLPTFSKNKSLALASFAAVKPSHIPNLNLTIADFKVGDFDLGKVILKSNSSKFRWHLDYCKILSPSYQMTIAGEWVNKGKENKTSIKADVKLDDLAKSLIQWNVSPAVEAHQGDLLFTGGWKGPFYDFSIKKVVGQLKVQLKNGRITHLSPETEEKLGLGKLLSILSLQTIPRRLTLDFSDLANDGYSFDVFKGSFQLKQGIMKTRNSYIDGPVAHASIKGNLDLAQRLYDLDLHVSPHITASLPVVATIAGGPIAGIATWVASKIINHGMQKISGYTYKISGPWLDPVVQQVSIIKKKS